MYSLQPFYDPNQDHFGFWFVLIIVTIVFLCYLVLSRTMYEDEREDRRPKTIWAIITWTRAYIVIPALLSILAFTAHVSWKPVPGPSNTRVIGTLVDGYETVELSGKRQTSPTLFVMYRVPEGDVSFKRQPGVVYPKQAILYKW